MTNLHTQTFFQTRFKRDRIRAAPILIFTTLLAGFASTQLTAQNLPTWMADQGAYIATVPMKGIAMPGTHDPATYKVPAAFDFYFKTQTVDFAGQLNNGTRWFDTRTLYLTNGCAPFAFGTCVPVPLQPDGTEVLPLPGAVWNGQADFYLQGHGFYSDIKLADALDQVKAFLDAHPKEIVILQLSGTITNGTSNLLTDSFMQVLDQHLRRSSDQQSYIYDLKTACTLSGNDYNTISTYEGSCDGPPLAPQEVTPQQLYGTAARVILLNQIGIATLYPAPSTLNLVWSDGDAEKLVGYTGHGAGTPNLEMSRLENGTPDDGNLGLYGRRTNWQDYEKDSRILTLQAELTPFGDSDSSDPYALLDFLIPLSQASYFNPLFLAPALHAFWQPNSVNVVSVDNEACCNIAQSIIAHNVLTFNRVPLNPNGASAFAIGKNGSVYKLGFSDSINHGNVEPDHSLYKLVGSGNTEGWAPVNVVAQGRGGATEYGIRLAVDSAGSIWIVQVSGQILKQDAFGNFQPVSGPSASDIAVGDDGSVFIIGLGGMPYQYNGTTWNVIPGITNAVRIAAGPTGTTTVVVSSGAIYQYVNGNWNNLNAPFVANSVGVDEGGHVWAIGPDSSKISSVWKFDIIWGRYRENGVTLAVGHTGPQSDAIYVADQFGNAHRLSFPVGARAHSSTTEITTEESNPSDQ